MKAQHKAIHKLAVAANGPLAETGGSDPWPGYKYTGSLRPHYPLSPMRKVPDHISMPDYAKTGIPLSEQMVRSSSTIEILSLEDIDQMRKVCQLAREVIDIGLAAIRVGVTTDEIDRIVHEATIERGCYPSTLNYSWYKKSCCTSVNEVVCHGIPDQRPLKDGDIVNLDVSLFKDGFHADLNETAPVGNVDETALRDLGNVIEKHAKSEGFSVVKTIAAHGIHRHFHCAPIIPHYARNKAIGVMKEGHVFTIEPMINEGGCKEKLWPDDWTSVTLDGKRSAQFEETMVVTKTGVEILTARKV
ncbi:Methionine aminopeptidase 1 [Mortierella polycephala]|uniref:Methionine aminopeptidase 1 n=1 Tax=Mortierella polycephala TaxID=41804 RepID=A0A9P6QAY9_9FUNG|nr:Methionine aminopeptidase 1 [Mortierella polycephala]